MWRPKIGEAAASIPATATASHNAGRRSTVSTMRRQKRPSAASARPRFRPRIGTRRALTRSPATLSSAGSRVSAAATETIPTRIAPSARLRMIEVGTMNIPISATTKVLPLKSTARLAVAPACAIASSFARPRPRSSR